MADQAPKAEKRKAHVTSIYPCRWAKLLAPDTRFSAEGEYSVHLLMTPVEEATFKASLKEEILKLWQAMAQSAKIAKPAPPIWPGRADEDENDVATGLRAVVFKQKVREGFDFNVQVFDSLRHPWPPKLLIGNGSKIRVSFNVRVVCVNAKFYICLHPQAVQVAELVKYERNYGFDDLANGYVAAPETEAPTGEYQGEPFEGTVALPAAPDDDQTIPF